MPGSPGMQSPSLKQRSTSMLKHKTLLVLGAGSSAEANLPVGVTLKERISALTRFAYKNGRMSSGDYDFHQLIAQQAVLNGSNPQQYHAAAEHISSSLFLSPSIDNFLHAHRNRSETVNVGKLAISKILLSSERNSILMSPRNSGHPDLTLCNNTFYTMLFQLLTVGVEKKDLVQSASMITVISFNYDRTVELFLTEALMAFYNISRVDAWKIVCSMKIIHPYGTLGRLDQVPFGADAADLLDICKGINTFTESIQDASLSGAISNAVSQASVIVFLGFGYLEQNMSLLSIPSRNNEFIGCYGTAFNVSDFNTLAIRSKIEEKLKIYAPKIHLGSMKCADLMQHFERGIAIR